MAHLIPEREETRFIYGLRIFLSVLAELAKTYNKENHTIRDPTTLDVFDRVCYIFPMQIKVENFPRLPQVAFNPGALLEGKKLYILPRLIFDYYKYVSSIGLFSIDIDDVLSKTLPGEYKAKIILWPKNLWEFKGCEDARVAKVGDEYWILYTGNRHLERELPGIGPPYEFQGFAKLDREWREIERKFLRFVGHNVSQVKDSAFLDVKGDHATMLLRPTIDGVGVGWSGLVNVVTGEVYPDSLKPILPVAPWELKVGWSTNAVKISSNEFLVGWHGVLRADYSYKNGFAIVDKDGDLLGVTQYLLAPRGIVEEYGDRPFVIFGDGLVLYKEQIIWVGGVSDYAIGIFRTEIDKILENVKWMRG